MNLLEGKCRSHKPSPRPRRAFALFRRHYERVQVDAVRMRGRKSHAASAARAHTCTAGGIAPNPAQSDGARRDRRRSHACFYSSPGSRRALRLTPPNPTRHRQLRNPPTGVSEVTAVYAPVDAMSDCVELQSWRLPLGVNQGSP